MLSRYLCIISVVLLTTIHGDVSIQNQKKCEEEAIPLSCLYSRRQGNKWTQEQLHAGCNCMDNSARDFCEWNKIYFANRSHFNTCKINLIACDKSLDLTHTTCFPPSLNYPNLLPPHPVILSKLSLKFCDHSMGEKGGMQLDQSDSDFYKNVFTCVLKDCGVRLRILDRKNATDVSGSLRWCLPPIMSEASPMKYCKLYSTPISTFNGFTTKYNDLNYDDMCVLPPPCGENGKVDRNTHMAPLINGVWNDTYCEKLCPLSHVKKGEQCLHVPPCQHGSTEIPDKWANRRIKLHICYPWCSQTDSIIRNAISRSVNPCIPIPPCGIDGKPIWSQNRWKSSYCVTIKTCADGQTTRTHICNATIKEEASGKQEGYHRFEMAEIVVISVFGALIIMAIIFGSGFVANVIIDERKHEQNLKDIYSSQGLDWKDYSRLRDGFCKESHLSNYNPNALRQALLMALKQGPENKYDEQEDQDEQE